MTDTARRQRECDLVTYYDQEVDERAAKELPADRVARRVAYVEQLQAEGRRSVLEVPDGANGWGLVEVGCLPNAGPGLSEVDQGFDAEGIRSGLADGILESAFLVNADPVRDFANGPAWSDALGKAKFILAISMFENASTSFTLRSICSFSAASSRRRSSSGVGPFASSMRWSIQS